MIQLISESLNKIVLLIWDYDIFEEISNIEFNWGEIMGNETDKSKIRLTQLASAAGCGAKIGPKVLAQVVGKLPKFTDPMLLVGPETSDDAAVYKINDELAMIHTVDFFPPVVDNPYMYGQIAAANALSDVYAMGGVPKLALNVVAFPNCLGPEVLEQILRGGADKVMEAGAVLAGGHTINDKEPKYGLRSEERR